MADVRVDVKVDDKGSLKKVGKSAQSARRQIGGVGHIEDVVVRKDYEGRGIGMKLVISLLNRAKEEKCYKTILDCKDDLKIFYERIGFKSESNCMRYNHD